MAFVGLKRPQQSSRDLKWPYWGYRQGDIEAERAIVGG